MLKALSAVALFFPALALAEAYNRPVPLPQSATAEWWFFAASVGLVLALLAVHLLVRRR